MKPWGCVLSFLWRGTHSHPGAHGQNFYCTSKIQYLQGLLPDKISQDNGFSWPWHVSHHTWNTRAEISFLWQRTAILYQKILAEIGVPPPKFSACEDCSWMKAARTDESGWPCPPVGLLSSAFQHWGFMLFFPWKELPISSRNPWPKFALHLQISIHPRISPRQKQLAETGLAVFDLPWATSHLHLEHWGYRISFLWKSHFHFSETMIWHDFLASFYPVLALLLHPAIDFPCLPITRLTYLCPAFQETFYGKNPQLFSILEEEIPFLLRCSSLWHRNQFWFHTLGVPGEFNCFS